MKHLCLCLLCWSQKLVSKDILLIGVYFLNLFIDILLIDLYFLNLFIDILLIGVYLPEPLYRYRIDWYIFT
jgi:hypothetical protein